MKLKILIALMAVGYFALPAAAQKSFSFNPEAGINFSALSKEIESTESAARAGWHAGADFRIGSGVAYFQPGIFYYRTSTRLRQENSENSFEGDVRINSLKVPVQLGLRLIDTEGFKLLANTGPVVNFPLSYHKPGDEFDFFAGNETPYKDVNLGYNVGLGIDILMLTFGIDYEFGLTDYYDYNDSENRNYVFSLSAGLRF